MNDELKKNPEEEPGDPGDNILPQEKPVPDREKEPEDSGKPRGEEAGAAEKPGPFNGEQFMDFDVWVASLEANFGPDFETVLSRGLGPDWIMKLNSRLLSGENFYRMIQELKTEMKGGGGEEEQEISFEALGRGEINGETGGGGGGPGGGGGSGTGGRLPLANLKKKEFEAADKLKVDAQPEHFETGQVLLYKDKEDRKEGEGGQEELVLMDRRDFSRLSYYAHKEIERHPDQPDRDKLFKRESREQGKGKASPLFLTVAVAGGLIFLYAVFAVFSFFFFTSYSSRLLKTQPPDLTFQPSTALHKQGGLALADKAGQRSGRPIVIYFLRTTLKRLELHLMDSPEIGVFDLAVCRPELIVIPKGLNGDSIAVRKHYPQHLPFSPSALFGVPLLTLSVNGRTGLSAYETALSGLFPGLTRLSVVDSGGKTLGEAYLAEGRLNLLWPGLEAMPAGSLDSLSVRLVLLFSLLDT
jgi:hypothetical protein